MRLSPLVDQDQDILISEANTGELVDVPVADDPWNDVFGSAPSSPTFEAEDDTARAWDAHPSEMPRLRQEHVTAGYRDGVTASKAKSIQVGFDEGFSLGATIGGMAGELLGILEGIANAVRNTNGPASSQAHDLKAQAKSELSTNSIFSKDYWDAEGMWTFEVKTAGPEDEIVFPDVAKAHPLIQKWSGIVQAQIQNWKIDPKIVGDNDTEHPEPNKRANSEAANLQTKPQDGLEW